MKKKKRKKKKKKKISDIPQLVKHKVKHKSGIVNDLNLKIFHSLD